VRLSQFNDHVLRDPSLWRQLWRQAESGSALGENKNRGRKGPTLESYGIQGTQQSGREMQMLIFHSHPTFSPILFYFDGNFFLFSLFRRLRVTFSCMMDLTKFPLDRQKCTMEVASCKCIPNIFTLIVHPSLKLSF